MAQNLSEQLSADLSLPVKVCYDTLQLMKSQLNSFLKKFNNDPEVCSMDFMKSNKSSFFKNLNKYFKLHKRADPREIKINNWRELYEALAVHLIIKLKSPNFMVCSVLDNYIQQMKDFCKSNKDINYKKFLSSKIKRTTILSSFMKAFREYKRRSYLTPF